MKRVICPYLGLKDDPTTSLDFPSDGNHCHHTRPIVPVKSSYQQKYCLARNHAACPIYQANKPVMMPLAVISPAYLRENGRRILALVGVPLLIAGITVLAFGWNVLGSRLTNQQPIPDTGNSPANPAVMEAPQNGQAPALLSPQGEAGGASPESPVANCPLPEGWVIYVVNPTDSLFRLSVIYGVTVEELQRVNCMDQGTAILPGQVIYIPYVPTKTPIFTSTPFAQPFQLTTIQPPVILPPASATPPDPTDSPATAVPPSAVPPTNTPVPPTATLQPPTSTPRPTNTPNPPTSTPVLPTSTPVPPTNTPVPPTSTPVPPTNTPPPPTNTPIPPTPVPPTSTPVPPTETSLPPTEEPTQPPPPTEEPPPPTEEPTQPPPIEESPDPTSDPPPQLTDEPPSPTADPPPLVDEPFSPVLE